MKNNSRINFIDLFAGAGGLSEGFIKNGFEPVAHIEMDEDACLTLKTRLSYHYLKKNRKLKIYNDYLNKIITREQLYSHIPEELLNSVINSEIKPRGINKIFDKINGIQIHRKIKKIDVIVGGPPCQAYSNIGRGSTQNRMKDDPRNFLYRLYIRFIKNYQPKIFIFENVPGMVTVDNGIHYIKLKQKLEKIGYILDAKILNAKDFGVVQNRKRLILIGWRKELKFEYPTFKKSKLLLKISSLFYDLPSLKSGQGSLVSNYEKKPSKYLLKSKIRNGHDVLTWHIARPHNKNDKKIYKFAVKELLNNKNRIKYCNIPKNLQTRKNKISFEDTYKVIKPNGISHTLVAHISKDGHHYIYPCIEQNRSISVREAARIQGFPDTYYFEKSRTSAFKQIGNAVPPLMSCKMANIIKKRLYGK